MTNNEILELGHRKAWRYKKSGDPHHSDTYTFNRSTLLEFARKLLAAGREACANEIERLSGETYAVVLCEHKEAAWLRSNV